jgi:3',5'-cyclic AMP phosphodiesterase CpdA
MKDSRSLRLLHISDLHFGRIEDRVLVQLEKYITSQDNLFHLAILTGDLTQRAKTSQFIAAKEFLAKLKCPLFLVPGNHDVPLFNPFLRFFNPYLKFKRFFKDHSPQFYEDDQLIVFGLWTVNNFTVKDATVDLHQVTRMEEKFKETPPGKVKLIAFHHPLVASESFRVDQALQRIREMRPHVMMWGHDHKAQAKYWDEKEQRGPVMVAAGTSVSSRTRQETNSFNILEVTEAQIRVRVISFNSEVNDFQETKQYEFDISKVVSL